MSSGMDGFRRSSHKYYNPRSFSGSPRTSKSEQPADSVPPPQINEQQFNEDVFTEPNPENQLEPTPESSSKISFEPKTKPKKKKSEKLKKVLLIIIFIAVICGAFFLGKTLATKDNEAKDKKINDLAGQISTLKAEKEVLEQANSKGSTNDTTTSSSSVPSQETLDNVESAITSGNTAALKGYMAPNVNIIIAASEGLGLRTSDQAVGDVSGFIKGAEAPWDFNLPSATLTEYGSGDYAQYFPSGALVGKSKNNYVISIVFNNAGKIITVFEANNANTL